MRGFGALWVALLLSVCSWAQVATTTYTLKVERPELDVQVFPQDSILWVEKLNHIKLEASGNEPIAKVTLEGGNLSRVGGDKHQYQISVKAEDVQAVLTVYYKRADGNLEPAFVKTYTIKERGAPRVLVDGVKHDSVCYLWSMVSSCYLTAQYEGEPYVMPVESYDLFTTNEFGEDSLHAETDQLTLPMKRVLHRLPDGAVLNFRNIKVFDPRSGQTLYPEPVRIFLRSPPVERVKNINDW